MKICFKCKFNKDTSQFHKNNHNKDGLNGTCIKCKKEYYGTEEWKNKRVKYNLDWKNRRRNWLANLKNKPCTDCGNIYHPWVMEYDHLGDKSFSIADGIRGTLPLKDLLKEIDKCELVCANCHRMRTYNRLNKNDN